tara:strand:+ start:892 stop:1446 length:555 start_codon:yes stop_codon:yes gene_type:complete
MEITRETVRLALYIFGPLILASYVFGIYRMDDPNQLWGGIPESWRPLNVACMFVSAAGFFIMFWFFLYHWDSSVVESIQWPWVEGNSGGHTRLLISFMLVTIPSMLWLELTAYHISSGTTFSQWLVIGNLWLVCLGNILLGLLAFNAHQQEIASDTIWPLIGALMLSFQVIGNDGIIWVIKYPW